MSDFSRLVSQETIILNEGEALVCDYESTRCRIEDAERVGITGKIIIMIQLEENKFDFKKISELNGDFKLTYDGYISDIDKLGRHYIRTIDTPSHPRELLTTLSKTVDIYEKILEQAEK